MAKPFDYSKWDHIELSDDESDLHPNIDKDSWFRMKHRARVEREEKEDQEKAQLSAQNTSEEKRVKELRKRLKRLQDGQEEDECEDAEALNAEITELQTAINQRNHRISEIEERRKWNIDNICKVVDERTVINTGEAASLAAEDYVPQGHWNPGDEKENESVEPSEAIDTPVAESAPAPAPTSAAPPAASHAPAGPSVSKRGAKEDIISYNDFVIGHEAILEGYCELKSDEQSEEYLFRHGHIVLHEHGQAYLLLSCLEDEMNGKHARALRVCRQSQLLSHITELATGMHRDPRDVVRPFFRRIEQKQYLDVFETALAEFVQRIKKRAVEKRKEIERERSAKSKPTPGPGGLDPDEVLESLPQSLQDAFASQDVPALHAAIASLPRKQARYHMRRCVAAGLWVPQNPHEFDSDEEEAAEETALDTDEEMQRILESGDEDALAKYLAAKNPTGAP